MSVVGIDPLRVHGLRVAFGDVRAVDGVDFAVPSGRVVGLVGPNGCGKTTTIHAVVGIVGRAGGSVLVAGQAAGTTAARGSVAWVPDEPRGLDGLTVAEWLDLVAALQRADAGYDARVSGLARAFGIGGRDGSQLGSLSHGMRRLVSIVAAVALARPLLVVDEATAALDPDAVLALREVVRAQAARGGAALIATQDLHFAETACDSVVLLSRGRVAASGTLSELRGRYASRTLEEIFVAAVGDEARLRELRSALETL